MAPAAWGGVPTSDGLGNVQQYDISAAPPVTKAGIVFDLQQTYWNQFGLPPRAVREVVLRFPAGVVWNGERFPQCDAARLLASGPSACPPNSQFATADIGTAVGPQATSVGAKATEFVGHAKEGHPTQLFYVVPQVGPPFVLTALVTNDRTGPYGIALRIDLTGLPGGTPLTPSPIVITSIHNVDTRSSVDGGHTPLIEAPATCTGLWRYAFDSVFLDGSVLRSTTAQPCVQASKAKALRPRPANKHSKHTRGR
jgi:hypothetical protein